MDALIDQPVRVLADALRELNNGIVRDTPVDTGTLKNSWTGSIGNPSRHKPVYKRPYSGSKPVDVTKKIKPGQTYYFVNNQSYAPHVEYGTQKQRPRAMLRKNLAKWPAIVRKHAAK